MLRRMALVDGGSAPEVESQEVAAGVEDFQVQFGIDTHQNNEPGFGIIDLYVNPDNPILARAKTRVLAVRVWVLLRSENTEPNYTNTASYQYANLASFQVNDSFRRLLVSKTIQIRNMNPVETN